MKFLLIDYEHSFKLWVHFSTLSLDLCRLACMSTMIVHGIYGPESPVSSFTRRWWSISWGKKDSRRRRQKQNVFSSYLTIISVFSSNISCTQHQILQMTLTLVPLFIFVSSPGANAFKCLKSLFSFLDLSDQSWKWIIVLMLPWMSLLQNKAAIPLLFSFTMALWLHLLSVYVHVVVIFMWLGRLNLDIWMDRDQHCWWPLFFHKIVYYCIVISKPPKHNKCHLLTVLGSRSSLVTLHQLIKCFC